MEGGDEIPVSRGKIKDLHRHTQFAIGNMEALCSRDPSLAGRVGVARERDLLRFEDAWGRTKTFRASLSPLPGSGGELAVLLDVSDWCGYLGMLAPVVLMRMVTRWGEAGFGAASREGTASPPFSRCRALTESGRSMPPTGEPAVSRVVML